MATLLAKELKRQVTVDGVDYTVAVAPDGFRLTGKGKRTPQVELRWRDLLSGDAAMAVALNASLLKKCQPATKPVTEPSPRVLRYWDSPPWKERSQAESFIAVCGHIEEEGTGARLAIERAADGVFIGWCCLVKWNPNYRSATMGYCLDDAAWGHGFATEAAGALLQWAFDTLDLNRVQAETDTRNTASCRVLEKLQFVREGTLREDCIVEGDVSDSWVYGLLRREWEQLHSRSAAG